MKKTVLLLRYCGRRSSRYFILMQYKLKMLQFIPNAPSTFLWAMCDAHSRMIHSFESILFKGLIKPVGKPVNRFANQFEWFVQFPAHALSHLKRFSLRVVTKFKNIKSIERSDARPVPGGLPLPRQLILIFSQYLRLQKYRLHLFTFCRTDGKRSVNVHLFRYVQMFGS